MRRSPILSQGFTLIELLVVIAILGILLAIGFMSYTRWRASSTVMQGAQQFAQAITATRTGAKRANACWQIGVVETTATNTQYQIKQYDAACPASGSTTPSPTNTRTYSMPAGTQLVHSIGASTISFRPPYGTADSVPDGFRVQWANRTSIQKSVRLTGIFGRVIIK